MKVNRTTERLYYGFVMLAALYVVVLELVFTKTIGVRFMWVDVPPLHARFIGALYLFATVTMIGCIIEDHWEETRLIIPLTAVFTGFLFLVSASNFGVIVFDRVGMYFWPVFYFLIPTIGIALVAIRRRNNPNPDPVPGPDLPSWVRIFLMVQGMVYSLVAALLLFAPTLMSTAWPWPMSPFLAQLYGGPMLAIGLGSLEYGRQGKWAGIFLLAAAMLFFTIGTLIASVVHVELFDFSQLADLFWFAFFGITTVVLGVVSFTAYQFARPQPAT